MQIIRLCERRSGSQGYIKEQGKKKAQQERIVSARYLHAHLAREAPFTEGSLGTQVFLLITSIVVCLNHSLMCSMDKLSFFMCSVIKLCHRIAIHYILLQTNPHLVSALIW